MGPTCRAWPSSWLAHLSTVSFHTALPFRPLQPRGAKQLLPYPRASAPPHFPSSRAAAELPVTAARAHSRAIPPSLVPRTSHPSTGRRSRASTPTELDAVRRRSRRSSWLRATATPLPRRVLPFTLTELLPSSASSSATRRTLMCVTTVSAAPPRALPDDSRAHQSHLRFLRRTSEVPYLSPSSVSTHSASHG
jgi:hypothetical protein